MGREVIAAVADDPQMELVAAIDRMGAPGVGLDAGVLAGLGGELRLPVTCELSAGLAKADVVIDFSLPDGSLALLAACVQHRTPAVVGTTGLGAAGEAALNHLAEVAPVVFAPNFSVGVNVLWALSRWAVQLLGPEADIEIVEMHHRHKVDAPSGTAARLLELLARVRGMAPEEVAVHGRSGHVGERGATEIGVHALRGGDVVGDHTLVLALPGERLELTHRAHGREIFARGAIRAARWVAGMGPGRYGMDDVLGLGVQ